MKYKHLLLFIPIAIGITTPAMAQTTIRQDAGIKQMVDEVSSQNIEAIVRKLVSFKTRSTLAIPPAKPKVLARPVTG
jgi:hypothetical protein